MSGTMDTAHPTEQRMMEFRRQATAERLILPPHPLVARVSTCSSTARTRRRKQPTKLKSQLLTDTSVFGPPPSRDLRVLLSRALSIPSATPFGLGADNCWYVVGGGAYDGEERRRLLLREASARTAHAGGRAMCVLEGTADCTHTATRVGRAFALRGGRAATRPGGAEGKRECHTADMPGVSRSWGAAAEGACMTLCVIPQLIYLKRKRKI